MSSLRLEERGDTLFVFITEAKILDDTRTQEIGSELLDFVERAANAGRRMVVDFRSVQFISSAMIGRLLLLNKAARAKQVELCFCNVSPSIMHVFRVTRLDKIFRLSAGQSEETIAGAGAAPSRTRTPGAHPTHATVEISSG